MRSRRSRILASIIGLAISAIAGGGLYLAASDFDPPVVALTIDEGSASTYDGALRIAVRGVDERPGALAMRVDMVDPGGVPHEGVSSGGGWAPLVEELTWTIPAGSPFGRYRLTARIRDAAGNIGEASDEIEYADADRTSLALAPRYTVSGTIDPARFAVHANLRIELSNRDARPISRVALSSLSAAEGEVRIVSLTVDDRAVTPLTPAPGLFVVPLGRNLLPGAGATIELALDAAATDEFTDSLAARFSHDGGLVSLAGWLPLLSSEHGRREPGDSQVSVAASFRASFRHPAAWTIAAPGTVERTTSGDEAITRFSIDDARELAFGMSDDFHMSRVDSTAHAADGQPVRIEVYTRDGVERKAVLVAARRAFEYLSARLGPYPYHRLVIVQSPRVAAANEYSGLVFLGAENLRDPETIAHAIVHQWFYGIVGSDQLAAPWLDEGLAVYLARLVSGSKPPAFCSVYPVDSPVTTWPDGPDANECDGYDQTVYGKSATMFAGLAGLLGEQPFWSALRGLVDDHRGGLIEEADLVEAMREAAADPREVDAFLYPGYLLP